MEKRIFLAIVLSIAVLVLWSWLAPMLFPELAKKPAPPPSKPAPQTATTTTNVAPPLQAAPAQEDRLRGGPTSVAPGSTAQYAAIAEYSDGSTKDVTADAGWSPHYNVFDNPIARAEFAVLFNTGGGTVAGATVEVLKDAGDRPRELGDVVAGDHVEEGVLAQLARGQHGVVESHHPQARHVVGLPDMVALDVHVVLAGVGHRGRDADVLVEARRLLLELVQVHHDAGERLCEPLRVLEHLFQPRLDMTAILQSREAVRLRHVAQALVRHTG